MGNGDIDYADPDLELLVIQQCVFQQTLKLDWTSRGRSRLWHCRTIAFSIAEPKHKIDAIPSRPWIPNVTGNQL